MPCMNRHIKDKPSLIRQNYRRIRTRGKGIQISPTVYDIITELANLAREMKVRVNVDCAIWADKLCRPVNT
jgi:hypothetical protein